MECLSIENRRNAIGIETDYSFWYGFSSLKTGKRESGLSMFGANTE